MKEIPLSNSDKVAIVSDRDYRLLKRFTWRLTQKKGDRVYYATTTIQIGMHNMILKANHVDHKDSDGLNNTRRNLRKATHSQNGANRRKQAGTSSQFKGVCFEKRMGKWSARIKASGTSMRLGCFDLERDAALAYNRAAKKHFGRFARINNVPAIASRKEK